MHRWNWPALACLLVPLLALGSEEASSPEAALETRYEANPSIPERADAREMWSAGSIRSRRLIHMEIGRLIDTYVEAWNEMDTAALNQVWHGQSSQRRASIEALVQLLEGKDTTRVVPQRTVREWEIIGVSSRGDMLIEATIELTPSRLDMVANPIWERSFISMRREQQRLRVWSIHLVEAGNLEIVEASYYQFSDARMRQLAREHFARDEWGLLYRIGFMDGMAITDLYAGEVSDEILAQLDSDPNSPDEHRRGIAHGLILGKQFLQWAAENPVE